MAKATPLQFSWIVLAFACSGPPAIDARIDEVARTGGFRGALLVAKHGRILLRKAYGPADEDSGAPNRPETRFRIGSITKQFVAAAIVRLRDRGRLDLTDSICARLAPCPVAWQPITLKHLLTHTSGLPDYTNLSNFPSLIGTPASTADLLSRFRDLPLEFAPGDHWSYSNSGYVVLGAVLESITGLSWGDHLRDAIFIPLGMSGTAVGEDAPAVPAHASGYLRQGVKPVFLAMSEFAAAGALASTVDDLFVWDESLRTGRVLSMSSLAEVPLGAHRRIRHHQRIRCRRVVIALSNLETTPTFAMSGSLQQLALEAP